MKVEDAKWNPANHGSRVSRSVLALRALEVGDVKRLVHNDVHCVTKNGHSSCTLAQEIHRLRPKLNWKLDYYHESLGVLIIKRLS